MAEHRYTLEITQEHMAGHGIYPEEFRVTVYFEGLERPVMKRKRHVKSLGRAMRLGEQMYAEVLRDV